jgi:hypothetical protein
VVVNSGRWRRPELPAEWAFCSGIVILVPFFPAFNSLNQSLNSPYMQAHKQKKNHYGLSLNSAWTSCLLPLVRKCGQSEFRMNGRE